MTKLKAGNRTRQKVLTAYGIEQVSFFFSAVVDTKVAHTYRLVVMKELRVLLVWLEEVSLPRFLVRLKCYVP